MKYNFLQLIYAICINKNVEIVVISRKNKIYRGRLGLGQKIKKKKKTKLNFARALHI